MQAIVETLFDTVYLFSVITIGILMIRKSKGNRQFTMFGIMAVLLGSGDTFHLVPRATALCTTGLENFTVQLGLGKWITSITMTIFYVVLYHIWRERYQIKGYKATTAAIYGLAGLIPPPPTKPFKEALLPQYIRLLGDNPKALINKNPVF